MAASAPHNLLSRSLTALLRYLFKFYRKKLVKTLDLISTMS